MPCGWMKCTQSHCTEYSPKRTLRAHLKRRKIFCRTVAHTSVFRTSLGRVCHQNTSCEFRWQMSIESNKNVATASTSKLKTDEKPIGEWRRVFVRLKQLVRLQSRWTPSCWRALALASGHRQCVPLTCACNDARCWSNASSICDKSASRWTLSSTLNRFDLSNTLANNRPVLLAVACYRAT
jgi:hypothetical protein